MHSSLFFNVTLRKDCFLYGKPAQTNTGFGVEQTFLVFEGSKADFLLLLESVLSLHQNATRIIQKEKSVASMNPVVFVTCIRAKLTYL